MTHVTNYAKDRLAPYLFENLFKFITRWTKLELLTDRPLNLGRTYFSLFPEEKVPLWTVSACIAVQEQPVFQPI
jgi:heparan sulfate N-deacetylase/N-sulfotransferase NDST2